jgi:hypothetical protein
MDKKAMVFLLATASLACMGFVWQAAKSGQMSAKVGGQDWSSNGSCKFEVIKTTLAITGTSKDGKNMMRLVVKDYKGPGSYVFKAADVTWQGKYYALSANKTTAEGKFTVYRADEDEVEGTFSFFCVPLAQNPEETPKVVADGKFTAFVK